MKVPNTGWARMLGRLSIVLSLYLGLGATSVVAQGSAQPTLKPNSAAEIQQQYSAGWSLPVGQVLPVLMAPDHTGKVRQLADLTGPNGLLLFLVRSADW